jgi:hypothetical protein
MALHTEQTPVGADNALFRRGLILGLTLAEISLLIVFVLMLVFGGLLKHVQAELQRTQALAREAAAAREQLRKVVEDYAPAASSQQIDKWVQELIAASVSAQETRDLKAELQSAESALERVEAAAEKSGLASKPSQPPKAGGGRWDALAGNIEAAAAEMRAGQAAARAMAKGGDAASRAAVEVQLENEQLKGAVANAQRKLEAAGKGTEKPACWATRDGRPEYIFDITLSGGGMRIHDRALAHRRAQQAILPLGGIHFDQVLPPQAFRAQTRPLFDWGEARGCRFFVVAIDGTGAAEKQIFKQRLRAMEEHFYKFLSN